MMTFPTEWKNKIHVPNHQPVVVFFVGHIDQEMVDLIFKKYPLVIKRGWLFSLINGGL